MIYLRLRYDGITITMQRDNDCPVLRIYQNYEVLHKKKKVSVCDICMRSSATSALRSHLSSCDSHFGQILQ